MKAEATANKSIGGNMLLNILNYYKPNSLTYSVLAFLSGLITWLFGDLTLGMAILISFTVMDFLTGLGKAARNGGVDSAKMPRVIYRLVGYPLLIIVLRVIFFHYMPTIPGFISEGKLFSDAMAQWFNIIPHLVLAICILREASSIIENLTEAEVIPESAAILLSKIFTKVRLHLEENATGIDKTEIVNNNQGDTEL